MDLQAILALAEKGARSAGARLRDEFGAPQKVLSEIGRDIKLQADQDAEALILEILSSSGYPVLAEESGEHGKCGSGPLWVVDPLDGTANYNRSVPSCCVSIALVEPPEFLVGVVYDFVRDELFSGIVGDGAWCNGSPISVSHLEKAAQAVISTGFPSRFDFNDPVFSTMMTQMQRFKKVRMIGAAALSLAYVACGRFDAHYEEGTMYWDIAAGAALVKAAGGVVEMVDSGQQPWTKSIRCASHAHIWDDEGITG
jgi:myo-inositol-1(or 4)-monophosphatase